MTLDKLPMHFERKLDQVIATLRFGHLAGLLAPGAVGVEATYRVQIDGRNFDFAARDSRFTVSSGTYQQIGVAEPPLGFTLDAVKTRKRNRR